MAEENAAPELREAEPDAPDIPQAPAGLDVRMPWQRRAQDLATANSVTGRVFRLATGRRP
jgi:hypothetical protein